MEINKLKLKHLTPYLPYKLKVVEWYLGKQIHDEFIVDCVNWDGENIGGSDATLDSFELERTFNLRDIKPILRPISSMSIEEIKELQDIVKDEDIYISVSKTNIWIEDNTSDPYGGHMELHIDVLYEAYEWLFKNHFDIFNLIRRGLAIEKI